VKTPRCDAENNKPQSYRQRRVMNSINTGVSFWE
jgi:hypothetical protein